MFFELSQKRLNSYDIFVSFFREIGGSPKRRQFRTVHQETLEQTVKSKLRERYSQRCLQNY